MRTANLYLYLCGVLASLQLTCLARAGDAIPQLHVPDGFVVERAATPPLVEYPMNGTLDDRGRLFVTENAGLNLNFEQLKEQLPSKVLLLQDTNHDGVFDKRTVFADKMTFPTGCLWLDGSLYVCAVPGLWKLTDTNNDGIADERKEIVTGFGSSGNAADLHGPYLGPEGWLYFCDGRNGHDLTLGDGTKWKGKAACIYRCKPDGSGLEVVFGGGFDNPVEIAFTPEGEPLVNVNIVQSVPFRVDAILYGIEGSNYPHADAWRELKRTGEFQPTIGELGWVATSGFMRYRGSALGEKYVGKYFSTQFNPHRVQMHTVERDGAGFHVTHEDFLTCDHPDFHPTDVLEDADGSLLIIDTGGWFRIGCPNSQIAKPDIKGAIYRVKAGSGVVTPSSAAHVPIDQTLLSTRLMSLNGGPDAEIVLLKRITDANPAIRREAASGLGRLRARAAVTPLLEAAAGANGDRFLQHAIIYALIRIADRDETVAGLKHKNPATRRTALIALDQMDGGNLTADIVLPHLASDDVPLREAAFGIVAAHAAWAEQVAPVIRSVLSKPQVTSADLTSMRATLSAFVGSPSIQAAIADLLNADATITPVRLMLLETISGSGLAALPQPWIKPLHHALAQADESIVRQTIEGISSSNANVFDAELLAIARDEKRAQSLRIAALSASMSRVTSLDVGSFSLLLAGISPQHPPLERLSAAQALAAAPLNDEQLKELAAHLTNAGPLELPALVSGFEQSEKPEVGLELIESLKKAKSLAGLTPAGLSQVLARFPQEIRDGAAPLMQKINPDGAAQKAHLASLQPLLTGGSRNRGQSVFFSKTAACSTCHAVGGVGGHVGPDLTKIASIRAPSDLLESVIYPSLSFARGYESYVIQTRSNQLQSGVLAAETADAIVLRTPSEVRIPRSAVKVMRQDRISIMPQGLEAQMSKEELSDLLAFLQSLK